jgi:hypothetical protein
MDANAANGTPYGNDNIPFVLLLPCCCVGLVNDIIPLPFPVNIDFDVGNDNNSVLPPGGDDGGELGRSDGPLPLPMLDAVVNGGTYSYGVNGNDGGDELKLKVNGERGDELDDDADDGDTGDGDCGDDGDDGDGGDVGRANAFGGLAARAPCDRDVNGNELRRHVH